MKNTLVNTFLLIGICLSISCSPYHRFYPYEIQTDIEIEKTQKIIIAPMNFYSGLPNFFNNQEESISDSLQSYISSNLTYIDKTDIIKIQWEKEIHSSNGLYNSFTGELNQLKFETAIRNTILTSLSLADADYIIVPHIIERDSKLAGSNGYWDGVIREIEMKTQHRHSSDYNFTGSSVGYSLQIHIYDTNGALVFNSIAGIESRYELDFKNNVEVMVPKTNLFKNESYIMESIAIAMHPFILTEIYPNKPKFLE